MSTPLRVLIVEDMEDDCDLLLMELLKGGFSPSYLRVETEEKMREALKESWELVISDFALPNFSGPAALAVFKESGVDIPFIIVSGSVGEDIAVATMRAGATDYIIKNQMARLAPAIQRELEAARARSKNRDVERMLKETEAQLLHAQKMEAVGRLAGGIAHDFNNMLSVIGLYCERIAAIDNARSKEYAEKILKVHAKAVALTRQLLIFNSKQVVKASVMNLDLVVGEMREMSQRLIGEDIELEFLLTSELDNIRADRGQVEQVLMNLLVNARDAMPDGGRVTIETKSVRFNEPHLLGTTTLQPGRYVLIEVGDNGTGIDRDVMARIFEPFFTTKERDKGTGLGLSIVYGIVVQSQGGVTVSSVLGQGTKFGVYFPVFETAQDSHSREISSVASMKSLKGNETILLVEDETELNELYTETLKLGGYHVHSAPDGERALAILRSLNGKVDLIVSDVVMPKMGGIDLLACATQEREDIKCLFMSGYALDAFTRARAFKNDFFILEKPFPESALLEGVRAILDGRSSQEISNLPRMAALREAT